MSYIIQVRNLSVLKELDHHVRVSAPSAMCHFIEGHRVGSGLSDVYHGLGWQCVFLQMRWHAIYLLSIILLSLKIVLYKPKTEIQW